MSEYIVQSNAKLEDLYARRKKLEKKYEQHEKTAREFGKLREESVSRLEQKLRSNYVDAKARHENLKKDISRSIHELTNFGRENQYKLEKAKNNYRVQVDELLPLHKHQQSIQLEKRIMEMKKETEKVKERREKFSVELKREEKVKTQFEEEKKALLVSLVGEQQDQMKSKARDIVRMKELEMIEGLARQQISETDAHIQESLRQLTESDQFRQSAKDVIGSYFRDPSDLEASAMTIKSVRAIPERLPNDLPPQPPFERSSTPRVPKEEYLLKPIISSTRVSNNVEEKNVPINSNISYISPQESSFTNPLSESQDHIDNSIAASSPPKQAKEDMEFLVEEVPEPAPASLSPSVKAPEEFVQNLQTSNASVVAPAEDRRLNSDHGSFFSTEDDEGASHADSVLEKITLITEGRRPLECAAALTTLSENIQNAYVSSVTKTYKEALLIMHNSLEELRPVFDAAVTASLPAATSAEMCARVVLQIVREWCEELLPM